MCGTKQFNKDLKAIAIYTTRSSKGSGIMGSEVPKDVLVDGAKENQRPEGCEVSTWRMLSLQTSNQKICKQLSEYWWLLENVVLASKQSANLQTAWLSSGFKYLAKHLYWNLVDMSFLSSNHLSWNLQIIERVNKVPKESHLKANSTSSSSLLQGVLAICCGKTRRYALSKTRHWMNELLEALWKMTS